jgi:hypothetical protein
LDYNPFVSSPFSILTAIVAPAVLTNASSVLALGTGNRLARVTDRTRLVVGELHKHQPGSPEYRVWDALLGPLRVRVHLLLRALRLVYTALGLFALSALVAVAGSIVGYFGQRPLLSAAVALGALTGTGAVSALVGGSLLLAREAQLAVQGLALEARLQQSP